MYAIVAGLGRIWYTYASNFDCRLSAVGVPVTEHRCALQLVLESPVVRVVVTKYRASCQGIRSTRCT